MYKIAALYKFIDIENPDKFRDQLEEMVQYKAPTIKGNVIVSKEGLNGTIAGLIAHIDYFIINLLSDIRFDGTELKYSYSEKEPFYRLRIALKAEIVTMGVTNLDQSYRNHVHYVESKDWNELIAREDTILIDTRNNYEVQLGTFNGAKDPTTDSFREFPQYIDNKLPELKDKKVAMFCTV